MNGYKRETRIKEWSDLHFIAFELQIRRMEDEVLWYRKEKLAGLAPSSFSYYLYEKKVKKFREDWELLYADGDISRWTAIEELVEKRICELLKQDKITEEDYPENEDIAQMKELHENFCIGWLCCLYFNQPIPEGNRTSKMDLETEWNRYGCMF